MGAGREGARPGLGPALALGRRLFADSRLRTIAFAYLFAAVSYVQPVAYRHSYPSVAERIRFAHSFADNKAVRLFYGVPHDLLTVGGYTAWRDGGILAIFAGVFGVLAAVRALRGEEDAGRTELVLSGLLTRRRVFAAALAAIAAGALVLWLAALIGLLAASLPLGESAFLALAIVSPVPVFAGVGTVASQLAPTRRLALELSVGVLAVTFALRVVADTVSGAGWVAWLTPLGWTEALRPFTGERPLVLLTFLALAVILLALALRLAAGRDIGTGLLRADDVAAPRFALLGSTTRFALRSERGTLAVWAASIAAFAFIVGVISKSISGAGISKQLQREFEKLGAGSIITPAGYLGFAFVFFVLTVALFAVSQVAAARHEEADEQLETLLALPVGRRGWFAGRIGLAAVAAGALSLLAGVAAWAGAAAAGASVPFGRMVEAGLDCLPVALLFLGVAALLYALLPRAAAGMAYALVAVAFLWELFGDLLGAPGWVVELSPFKHAGMAPAQPFRAGAFLVMAGIGAAAAAAAVQAFRRRDLLGA